MRTRCLVFILIPYTIKTMNIVSLFWYSHVTRSFESYKLVVMNKSPRYKAIFTLE